MSNIDKLTALQNSLGYIQGTISPVALLGLLGEAGEVAAEILMENSRRGDWSEEGTMIASFEKQLDDDATKFYKVSAKIDILKKRIRSSETLAKAITMRVFFEENNNFDMELADAAYYLNALAIARGKTLEDLAGMAHKKVEAKIAKTNDRHL